MDEEWEEVNDVVSVSVRRDRGVGPLLPRISGLQQVDSERLKVPRQCMSHQEG